MPDTRHKTRGALGCRRTPGFARVSRFTGQTRGLKDGDVPEWMTRAWKQRVEAEARLRLERNVRGSVASR